MTRKIVEKIIKASGIKSGELVLLHYFGRDVSKEIITYFCGEIAAIGATPVLLQEDKHRNQVIFEVATEEVYNEKYFKMIDLADAVIDLIDEKVGMLLNPLEDEKMQLCRTYMGKLFAVLQSKNKFLQIRIPSVDNAVVSGLELEDYTYRMESAYDIDYTELKSECQSRIEKIEVKKSISLLTGTTEEFCLNFSTEGRKWYADAGDGDLPCGEVYVAVEEEKTIGNVFFETFYMQGIEKQRDVILEIMNGKVVSSNNIEVNRFLSELEPCDKVVCELGFGMNKNIKSMCGYQLLDEKMCGTFHIALGDNTMFGGKNEANIHSDIVGFGTII